MQPQWPGTGWCLLNFSSTFAVHANVLQSMAVGMPQHSGCMLPSSAYFKVALAYVILHHTFSPCLFFVYLPYRSDVALEAAAFEDCLTCSVVCLGGLLVALGDATADVLHRGMPSMHVDEDDIRIHMGSQDHQ